MRIVWHCADRVGNDMAGPGIRAVELSSRLAHHHEVTLVAEGATSLRSMPFEAVAYTSDALSAAARGADVLITQGFGFPIDIALRMRGRLVLDLYDPVQLEQLAQFGPDPTAEQRISLAHVRVRLLALLRRADHILCASSVQRTLWLGWLGAVGRLAPATLAGDPEARRLVGIVPFGIPDDAPVPEGHPLRGELALQADVPLVLFWGGLWDWMDPSLAVRAIADLRGRGKTVHLAFLAGPRPGGGAMRAAADDARAATAQLSLLDRVHFLEHWIAYARRGAVLLDADLALTAHRPCLEAEFAFRTRLLDCVWARLPFAGTRGDVLSAEAEREGWGRTVPPGDASGLAAAVEQLLQPAVRGHAQEAMKEAAGRYRWSRSAETLLELIESPVLPRPPLFVPGEALGGRAGALIGTAAVKLWRRLWKRQ